MREIKFRGKRIDNGDWIFGNFIFDEEWQKAYISYPKKGAVYITLKSDEVDAKTVGQFTGLLDKEKKEIYEGDIVEITIETTLHEWEHKERLTVVYKCASFCLENERRSTLLHKDKYESEREIIGNIYENQELLGVK